MLTKNSNLLVRIQYILKFNLNKNKALFIYKLVFPPTPFNMAPRCNVMGHFGPIPVRTPGGFGPIPFGSGRFGPILGVGRFGSILVDPLFYIVYRK